MRILGLALGKRHRFISANRRCMFANRRCTAASKHILITINKKETTTAVVVFCFCFFFAMVADKFRKIARYSDKNNFFSENFKKIYNKIQLFI